MTEAEWKVLDVYVGELACMMGLKDWTITLERAPSLLEGAIANMSSAVGCKLGSIWVCSDFREKSADMQREAIVHELVHFHLEPAWEFCRQQMSRGRYEAIKIMMEYGVDGIASSFADVFDPIPWPKPARNAKKSGARKSAAKKRAPQRSPQ